MLYQARDFDDPPGLMEKTEYLLREWISMHYSATAGRDPTRAFSVFVQQVWPFAVSIHTQLHRKVFSVDCSRTTGVHTVGPSL
jgi:hypothetical protein